MSTDDRAAQLRALADDLEKIAKLEAAAANAKAAYRKDPTGRRKAAHRKASAELNEARDAARAAGVMTAANEPGSVTVSPAPVGKGG